VIQVRDSAFGGGDAAIYRLHVGRFPRPTALLPGGGRPGETLEVHWLGDVGGERAETLTLPVAATPEFGLVAHDDRGFAPRPFRFAWSILAMCWKSSPTNRSPRPRPSPCRWLVTA